MLFTLVEFSLEFLVLLAELLELLTVLLALGVKVSERLTASIRELLCELRADILRVNMSRSAKEKRELLLDFTIYWIISI